MKVRNRDSPIESCKVKPVTTNHQQTGTRAFSILAAVPFDRLASKESVREKLIERGGRVESFAGSHYRAYSGIGWRLNHQNHVEKYSVKGRVVIDAYGWNRFNPNFSVYVTPLYVVLASSMGMPELTESQPLQGHSSCGGLQ